MKDGHGTTHFTSGAFYTGEYSKDKKHGPGQYTYDNGDVYRGNFKDDMMHDDKAMVIYADGETVKRKYENDKLIKDWTDEDDKKEGAASVSAISNNGTSSSASNTVATDDKTSTFKSFLHKLKRRT